MSTSYLLERVSDKTKDSSCPKKEGEEIGKLEDELDADVGLWGWGEHVGSPLLLLGLDLCSGESLVIVGLEALGHVPEVLLVLGKDNITLEILLALGLGFFLFGRHGWFLISSVRA